MSNRMDGSMIVQRGESVRISCKGLGEKGSRRDCWNRYLICLFTWARELINSCEKDRVVDG